MARSRAAPRTSASGSSAKEGSAGTPDILPATADPRHCTIALVLDRIGAIRGESARIADLLDGADLDARVPSCPDWALRDLVLHLGEVQRSWAGCLRARRADEPWEGAVAG